MNLLLRWYSTDYSEGMNAYCYIQVPISCRQASILVVVTDETESSEK